MPRIVADPAIPGIAAALAPHEAELVLVPGRQWTPALVREADALLLRSVTRVDRELLQGSRVRFVASATSGIDHVDTGWLARQGIDFVHARGCNARSVAEYVLACLLVLYPQGLEGLTVGIVGRGEVGSRLQALLGALGVRCLVNDPPLAEQGVPGLSPLEALTAADVISLHVPLTREGPHPTQGLIGDEFLAALKPGTVLINSARGGVVEESALLRWLAGTPGNQAVIDCWQGEPEIDPALLQAAVLATPHIAGYSLDGRLRAGRLVYQALCRAFGWEPLGLPACRPPAAGGALHPEGEAPWELLRSTVLSCYDPRCDAAALHRLREGDGRVPGTAFEALRRDYPVRREFPATAVRLERTPEGGAELLQAAGFHLSRAGSPGPSNERRE